MAEPPIIHKQPPVERVFLVTPQTKNNSSFIIHLKNRADTLVKTYISPNFLIRVFLVYYYLFFHSLNLLK